MQQSSLITKAACDLTKRRFLKFVFVGGVVVGVEPYVARARQFTDPKSVEQGIQLIKAAPSLILDYAEMIKTLVSDVLLVVPATAATIYQAVKSGQFTQHDVNRPKPAGARNFHESFDPFKAVQARLVQPTLTGIDGIRFAFGRKPVAGGFWGLKRPTTEYSPAEAKAAIDSKHHNGPTVLFDGLRTPPTADDQARLARLKASLNDKKIDAKLEGADMTYVRRLNTKNDLIGYGFREKAEKPRNFFVVVADDVITNTTASVVRAQLSGHNLA